VFNEWIQPNVVAEVKVSEDRVHILTKECSMTASELISGLQLDRKWYMVFESTLTWTDNIGDSDKEMRGLSRLGVEQGSNYGLMIGRSRVDVWCEVAQGLLFMPRDVLQNACNLAMHTLMQSLLPIFMNQLSADYDKWATNKEYREERTSWNMDRFKHKI